MRRWAMMAPDVTRAHHPPPPSFESPTAQSAEDLDVSGDGERLIVLLGSLAAVRHQDRVFLCE